MIHAMAEVARGFLREHTDYIVDETQTDFRTIGQTIVTGRATGLRASLRKTPAVGDCVGQVFEVEASLGDKRFTVVHKTFDERFELRLLKDVDPDHFRAVATDAALTSHSNLGVIVDARVCPTFGPYAVIGMRRGLELAEVIADGVLSIDMALQFAIGVGGALASLHENGVSHGLRDFRDIVCGSEGEWVLCGAGLPPLSGAIAPFSAPEVKHAADVSPRADQWMLAASVYQMLAGKAPKAGTLHGPGQRRPGVPKAVDEALVRALSIKPEDRFATIDEFVDALQSNFFVWRQPSMVPVDAREISRLLKMHPDVVGGFDRSRTRQSVVVNIADLKSAKPRLEMAYQNIARLRREYRHNLSHGGIFVPTASLPEPGIEVTVVLSIGDGEHQQVELSGVISHVTDGDGDDPPGVGVVFDAESLSRLTRFIRNVGVLHRVPADSVVGRSEDFVELDKLSADGLFLLSHVMNPIKVGELRVDCASLPFDFDEALAGLIDLGALTHDAGDETPGENAKPTEVDYEFGPDDIYAVLELVDFHYERRALIGAAAVARQNERYFSEDGRLYFRAARVWADGLHDVRKARRYARAAVAANPSRRDFRDMQSRIEAMITRDSIQQIFAREFPVTDVHFIAWDAIERTVWVNTTSRLQPDRARVLGIDVRRDTIRHSETYPYHLEVHPVWSPQTDHGEAPTLFKGSSRPANVSPKGDWLFDRSPKTGEPGVFVLDRAGSIKTFFDGECWGLQGSFCGRFISWAAYVDEVVGVFVAPVNGDPRQVFATGSAVRCFWSGASPVLAVYDAISGEIWRITPDGEKERAGTQPEMFDDIVADSSGQTVAMLYQKPGITELRWLDVGSAEVKARQNAGVPARQLVLRSDGCYVGTTDYGTLLGSFALGTDRHVKGLRLDPRGLHSRRWEPGEQFVAQVIRKNGLELAALNPELLLE